jgi:broad specificity phosphatase PhoE
MHLYIRHAEKLFVNGKKPKDSLFNHDPPLTDEGCRAAMILGKELADRYGVPTTVVVSPYRRCRETAAMMLMQVQQDVNIVVDRQVGEYLGHHDPKAIETDPITASFSPFYERCFNAFTKRCCLVKLERNGQNDRIIPDRNDKNDKIVWVISHGVVIKTITQAMFKRGFQVNHLSPQGDIVDPVACSEYLNVISVGRCAPSQL